MKNRGLPEQIAATTVSDVILPRSMTPVFQNQQGGQHQSSFETQSTKHTDQHLPFLFVLN